MSSSMVDDIWCRLERGQSLSFSGIMTAITGTHLVAGDGDFLVGFRLRL